MTETPTIPQIKEADINSTKWTAKYGKLPEVHSEQIDSNTFSEENIKMGAHLVHSHSGDIYKVMKILEASSGPRSSPRAKLQNIKDATSKGGRTVSVSELVKNINIPGSRWQWASEQNGEQPIPEQLSQQATLTEEQIIELKRILYEEDKRREQSGEPQIEPRQFISRIVEKYPNKLYASYTSNTDRSNNAKNIYTAILEARRNRGLFNDTKEAKPPEDLPVSPTPDTNSLDSLPSPLQRVFEDVELEQELNTWLQEEFNALTQTYPILQENNFSKIPPLYQFAQHIINLRINEGMSRTQTRAQANKWSALYLQHLTQDESLTQLEKDAIRQAVSDTIGMSFEAVGYFKSRIRNKGKHEALHRSIAGATSFEGDAPTSDIYLEGIDEMKVEAVRWYYTQLTGNPNVEELTPVEFDELVAKWSQLKNISRELLVHGVPMAGALIVGAGVGYATSGLGLGLWHALSAVGTGIGLSIRTGMWNREARGGSRLHDMQLLGGLAKLDKGFHDGAYYEPPEYSGLKEEMRVFWHEKPSRGVRFDAIARGDLHFLLNRGKQDAKTIQKRTSLALAVVGVVGVGLAHQTQIAGAWDSFWSSFTTATPPVTDAVQVVANTAVESVVTSPTVTANPIYNCKPLCDSGVLYGIQDGEKLVQGPFMGNQETGERGVKGIINHIWPTG